MVSELELNDQEIISEVPDLSLLYLLAELARIDALIQRQVYRWRQAGQNPNDDFRGLYVSDAEAVELLKRPFAASWGDTASLDSHAEQVFIELEARAIRRAQNISEQAKRAGIQLRLPHLAGAFDLSPFEVDTLLVCLAPYLDLRYERLYGYLQDDVTRKQPSLNLALNLLCPPGLPRLERQVQSYAQAPLFKHRLLVQLKDPGQSQPNTLNQPLAVDGTIVSWLLGQYRAFGDFAHNFRFSEPAITVEDELLAGPNSAWPESLQPEEPILIFYGPDRAAKQAAARLFAARSGRSLLEVDLGGLKGEANPNDLTIRLALRDARLTGALISLEGWSGLAEYETSYNRFLADIFEHPGPVILNSEGDGRWFGTALCHRSLFNLEFPLPNYAQRRALWEHFVDQKMAEISDAETNSSESLDLTQLAGQFTLCTAQISAAVSRAFQQARQSGAPLEQAHLLAAARLQSSAHLSSLARKIMPHYDWEDIVLPEDQIAMLGEIVAAVRGRSKVLEVWGLGQKLVSSTGITIIFAGPPGTRKTMAAEIIAAELGLDLYKIDLSSVVSKYIGETEKNLERIFMEATSSNGILLFDEADALFGKRSEVHDDHDRYANIEISYLLQRMEAYDGVTILASNLRANLDEAFTRRLQFVVDFPFPDENQRLRIWQTLFPQEVPRQSGLDFGPLAQRYKLAGGNIRNAVVSAAYLAAADGGVVTMGQLMHGTRRELQKMGRLVSGQ